MTKSNNMPSSGDLVSRADVVKEFIKLFGCIQDISDIDEWADICQTTIREVPSANTPNNTQTINLISRQDALKPFCIAPDGTRIPEVDCDNFPVEFNVEFIKKHLLSLPSIDRPQGKWIWDENAQDWGIGAWVCNQCRRINNNLIHQKAVNPYSCASSHFCPNCGARMTPYKGDDTE